MNYYLDNGIVTLNNGNAGLAFILNDDSNLDQIMFKVMKDRTKTCFVRCTKSYINGKLKITYLPREDDLPLSAIIGNRKYSNGEIIAVIADIFKSIVDVTGTGFFESLDIDTSFDRIFVDTKTSTVQLLCMPVTHTPVPGMKFSAENDLRSSIIKEIKSNEGLRSGSSMNAVISILSNGNYSCKDIYQELFGLLDNKEPIHIPKPQVKPDTSKDCLTLESVKAYSGTKIVFRITETPYIIGRSESKANGVISSDISTTVGRTHCKIIESGGRYYAVDLNSKNKTRLNGNIIQPEQAVLLKEGYKLAFANVEFVVKL